MIETKKVTVNLPNLKDYADLGNIKQELRVILKYCQRASKVNEDNGDDWIVVDSLVTSGIVRYARIFHSGKRLSLNINEIQNIEQVEIEAHNYVLNLRNKYVAHSVNEYERSTLVAFLEFDNNRFSRVTHIANEPARIIFTKNNAWALEQLSKKILSHVETLLLDKYEDTLNEVRSQPEDFLLSCQPKTTMTIDPKNVARARK